MGSKGNKVNQTQSQVYTPSPYITNAGAEALVGAQSAVERAQAAGFNPDQLAAFQSIRNLQGGPYQQYGLQYLLQSGSPLEQSDIDKYLNPYADYVRKNLQEVFGQQMRDTTGRLTQQAGGVGADRIAVGQAELARQQDLATGQTMAGIYQNALTAAEQEKQRQYMTAMGMPGLQSSNLQGISALLGAGGQQQAFPLQLWQYLAGITGGLSGAMGGTQVGQSTATYPTPSVLNQILGIGTAAAGAYGAYNNGKGGGSPQGYNNLGTDYANNGSGIYTGDASIPGFGGQNYAYGGGYGTGGVYAEGGAVDDEIDPLDTGVPNIQVQSQAHPFAPMPSGGGGGGGGGSSALGDVAKIASAVAPFLMLARGGAAPNFHHNPIKVNPWTHHTGPSGSEVFHSMMPDGMEAPAFRYVRRASGGTVNPWDNAQRFAMGGSPYAPWLPDFPDTSYGNPSAGYSVTGGLGSPNAVALPMPTPQVEFPPAPAGDLTFPPPPTGAPSDVQSKQIDVADDDEFVPAEISSAGRNPYTSGPISASAYNSGPINQDLTLASMEMPRGKLPYPDATDRDWGQNLARSPWLSLIEGGAKMAQTVGPVGSAIGAGIQAGVGALSNQRKELRNEQQINQKAEELHRHAIQELNKYQRKTPHEAATEAETKRLHDITDLQRREVLAEQQYYHDLVDRRQREQMKLLDAQRRDQWMARRQERQDSLATKGFPGIGPYPDGTNGMGFWQFDPTSRKYQFQPGMVQTNKTNTQPSAEVAAVAALNRQTQEKFGRDATADEIAALKRSLRPMPPAMINRSNNAGFAIGQVDEAISLLTDAMSGKSGAVSGLPGMANRYIDWAKYMTNGTADTRANDFQQLMLTLHSTLPRIINATSITNANDRNDFTQIIGGLSSFKSPPDVMSNLKRLREILVKIQNQGIQTPEGPAAPSPALPPKDGEFYDFPGKGKLRWDNNTQTWTDRPR